MLYTAPILLIQVNVVPVVSNDMEVIISPVDGPERRIFGPLPLIITRKLLLAFKTPSLTVTAIVLVPVCPRLGVTVTVRFELLPPKLIPVEGTRLVLDELAESTRFD